MRAWWSWSARCACVPLLAALDVHPRVAMRILRHAQIEVTMDVYTEVSDEQTLKALTADEETGSLPVSRGAGDPAG